MNQSNPQSYQKNDDLQGNNSTMIHEFIGIFIKILNHRKQLQLILPLQASSSMAKF
jgi:hypothetical protein